MLAWLCYQVVTCANGSFRHDPWMPLLAACTSLDSNRMLIVWLPHNAYERIWFDLEDFKYNCCS